MFDALVQKLSTSIIIYIRQFDKSLPNHARSKGIDVPPQDILKSNEYDQNTECENDRLNPISSCSNVRSPLNDSGYLSALDIELTADAPENIGLLFTDAAHIVFNNSKRKSLRRKSTSSEHEDVE